MATGPKTGWGGKRPGAGAKPGWNKSRTRTVIEEFLASAKKRAKETGKTLQDVLLDTIYSKKEDTKFRLAAMKIYLEVIVPKRSETEVTVNKGGKAVKLPEIKPDPAKIIQMKGTH